MHTSFLQWIALAGGLLGGALNYALLSEGCKRITGATHGAGAKRTPGGKRGTLWILGGMLVPVAGLALCAALSPALLLWFGCACAGALVLPAVARMLYTIRKKK